MNDSANALQNSHFAYITQNNLLNLFFFTFMFWSDKKQSKPFVSYSKYLRDRKEKQMQQIKKIKSISQKKEGKEDQIVNQRQNANTKVKNFKGECLINQKENSDKQKWIKIDDKAVIVNGKLVYIQEEKPILKNVDQLIGLLKDNKVKIKEYIYGDKCRILQQISDNYESKKRQQVQKYINKNMTQEHTIQANCSQWYNKMKYKLFQNDH